MWKNGKSSAKWQANLPCYVQLKNEILNKFGLTSTMCAITKGDRRKQSTSLTDSTGELGWEKVTEAFNPPRERVDPRDLVRVFTRHVPNLY